MILLEIDSAGLAIFEFERDAPRSINVDRIAFRVKAMQGVKVEARDIHFLGADVFSFGEGVELADGDLMEIELAGFGRALRNPIRVERSPQKLVKVAPV